MLLSGFVCFTNWIFTHYASEEVRLKVWMGIGTVLFCHTKENADHQRYSSPPVLFHQILEDMIEKEVKKRVEKEEESAPCEEGPG